MNTSQVAARIAFSPETLEHSEWIINVVRSGTPAGRRDALTDPLIEQVDLNKFLIKKPRSTYGLTAYGDSMLDDGIETGDLLIVDTEAEPTEGSIVVMEVDGEFTIKKYKRVGSHLYLIPGNKNFKPEKIRKEQECKVWGVVRWIIKKV